MEPFRVDQQGADSVSASHLAYSHYPLKLNSCLVLASLLSFMSILDSEAANLAVATTGQVSAFFFPISQEGSKYIKITVGSFI